MAATTMCRTPAFFEITFILFLALSWIVFRTFAVFPFLWLIKITCQGLHALGLLPPLQIFPRAIQWFAVASTNKPEHLSATILGMSFSTTILKVFERLVFHPLSRFPGPKLGAFTKNYEFYYDVICPGQYTFVLKALHDKYGPIIRVSPSELHVIDPDFHEQLYTGASDARDKWEFALHFTGDLTPFSSTLSHEQHARQRAPLEGMFSKDAVDKLSGSIQDHIERLCQRVSEYRGSSEPILFKYAFSALTMDVVTEYSWGKCQNALHSPDFQALKVDEYEGALESLWLPKYLPLLSVLVRKIPRYMRSFVGPGVAVLDAQYISLEEYVKEVQKRYISRSNKKGETIFYVLLTSPELPVEERSSQHLVNQAQDILLAGVNATAAHLWTTTFHILSNPKIEQALRRELEKAIPDPMNLPSLAALEKLEYLSAVIAEGHRLSHGIVHRMPRGSPYNPIKYGDWTIPVNVPVGMSPIFTHLNEDIFPSPHEFHPERFLGEEGQERKMYLIPFGRGTRRCLGEHLATAEIYFTLAALFRRFDMELFETTREDIDMARDYLIPLPKKGSRGLRVLIK